MKSSDLIPLLCTTSRRNPTNSNTNHWGLKRQTWSFSGATPASSSCSCVGVSKSAAGPTCDPDTKDDGSVPFAKVVNLAIVLVRKGATRHTLLSSEQSHVRVYLTECIYQLVLESQLLHEIVELLFTIADSNNKLTFLWES